MKSKEFAEQADVSPKSYSQWESGDFRISIDGAIKIQSRYGISLDFIYTGRLDTLPIKMASAVASSPLLKNTKASTVNPES
ncbi:helix-turn-helix transcriptional regulator [Phaeobacter gallaeciensis]